MIDIHEMEIFPPKSGGCVLKIKARKSFSQLTEYCASHATDFDGKKMEVPIFTNMAGTTSRELSKEVALCFRLRPNKKVNTGHLIVSPSIPFKTSSDLMRAFEIAREVYDFSDTPWASYYHREARETHPHGHLAFSLIRRDGSIVNMSHSYRKNDEAAKRIMAEFPYLGSLQIRPKPERAKHNDRAYSALTREQRLKNRKGRNDEQRQQQQQRYFSHTPDDEPNSSQPGPLSAQRMYALSERRLAHYSGETASSLLPDFPLLSRGQPARVRWGTGNNRDLIPLNPDIQFQRKLKMPSSQTQIKQLETQVRNVLKDNRVTSLENFRSGVESAIPGGGVEWFKQGENILGWSLVLPDGETRLKGSELSRNLSFNNIVAALQANDRAMHCADVKVKDAKGLGLGSARSVEKVARIETAQAISRDVIAKTKASPSREAAGALRRRPVPMHQNQKSEKSIATAAAPAVPAPTPALMGSLPGYSHVEQPGGLVDWICERTQTVYFMESQDELLILPDALALDPEFAMCDFVQRASEKFPGEPLQASGFLLEQPARGHLIAAAAAYGVSIEPLQAEIEAERERTRRRAALRRTGDAADAGLDPELGQFNDPDAPELPELGVDELEKMQAAPVPSVIALGGLDFLDLKMPLPVPPAANDSAMGTDAGAVGAASAASEVPAATLSAFDAAGQALRARAAAAREMGALALPHERELAAPLSRLTERFSASELRSLAAQVKTLQETLGPWVDLMAEQRPREALALASKLTPGERVLARAEKAARLAGKPLPTEVLGGAVLEARLQLRDAKLAQSEKGAGLLGRLRGAPAAAEVERLERALAEAERVWLARKEAFHAQHAGEIEEEATTLARRAACYQIESAALEGKSHLGTNFLRQLLEKILQALGISQRKEDSEALRKDERQRHVERARQGQGGDDEQGGRHEQRDRQR